MTEPGLISKLAKLVDPSRLSDEPSRLLCESALAYYAEYARNPTQIEALQGVRSMVDRGTVKVDRVAMCAAALMAASEGPTASSDYLFDLVAEAERKSAVWLAIERSMHLWKSGQIEDIPREVERAASVGVVEGDPGVDYLADLAARTARRKDGRMPPRLPTGLSDLDAIMRGGLAAGELGCVLGAPKSGKCHAAGQGIMMYDGTIKPVENVKVGELVMGPDSQPRRVMGTNRGRGEMYEVCPNYGGIPWRVNQEHVLTLAGTKRYEGQVIDVSVKEWLGWSANRKRSFKLLKVPVAKFGGGRRKLSIDPYFLGVLLGDGSIQNVIGVTTEDPEILDEVELQVKRAGLRCVCRENTRGGNAPTYFLSGTPGKKNPLAIKLAELGLWGRSCGDKFIPWEYKTAGLAERLQLLAGLLDTDGSYSRTRGGSYEFVSKSKVLADGVVFVARSLGLRARACLTRKACQTGAVDNYYRVHLYGELNSVPCRVARKRAAFGLPKRNPQRSGFNIAATGVAEAYYGFSLDGDSRYLLDDFTVTHNSQALNFFGLHALSLGLTVVEFTLELSALEKMERLDAAIADLPIRDLVKHAVRVDEAVVEWMDRPRENGRRPLYHVKEMAGGGTTTAREMSAYLRNLAAEQSIKPDLVIVDYGDEMGSMREYRNRFEELGGVYSELKGVIAKGFNVPCWTASQTRRDALTKDTIGAVDIGESFKKIAVADIVLGICQSEAEQKSGLVRVGIAESRFSADGIVVGPYPTAYERGLFCLRQGDG